MSRPTTCRTARLLVGALSVIATIAWSSVSRAQVPAPAAPAATAPAGAPPTAPAAPTPPPAPTPQAAPTPPTAPLAPPPPAAEPASPATPPVAAVVASEASAPSDLDTEARPWAIGYSGLSQVPLGLDQTTSSSMAQLVDSTVPAIGVRYWASPLIGIDVAIGFAWSGGSIDTNGTTSDKDKAVGLLVQGGVPLALATYRHISFQAIPYFAIAHGQTSRGVSTFPGNPGADLSGTRVEAGARGGFEVFFGFIGLPQLALSATVGFRFEYRKYSASAAGLTNSDTTYGVSTTVQNSPWDIFTGNVAARYYF